MDTTANTISRWETATYKPGVGDLDRLARFFGVSITTFFPDMEQDTKTQALLSATSDLNDDDFEELGVGRAVGSTSRAAMMTASSSSGNGFTR
jgi:transcriptional regulator with XRE-family HTH domain